MFFPFYPLLTTPEGGSNGAVLPKAFDSVDGGGRRQTGFRGEGNGTLPFVLPAAKIFWRR
jgi:hypothetical protein